MGRNLYLFTGVYPYHKFGDNFLEGEMDSFHKEFDKIIIIPYRKETSEQKLLPSNCSVLPPILDSTFMFSLRGIFSFKGIRLFIPELFRQKVFLNKKRFSVWVKAYTFFNNLINRRDISSIEKNLKKEDVCYFYWGKWGNLLSVIWKGKAHLISRFHGEWDLWEESSGNYTPLRDKVAKNLDLAAFISKKGEDYFKRKYKTNTTIFAPLGSYDIGVSKKSRDNVVRIFTCSNVIPLKRVDLIFECINKFANNNIVEWNHIGGGVGLENLRDYVLKCKNNNLTVRIPGVLDHSEVINFYHNNPIDLFINLSTIEGVPVSIMEAISCDVPVIATNVGAVSEIVTEETGVLLPANPSVDEVVDAIKVVLSKNYTPRLYWKKHYNAETNYAKFIKVLLSLK